MEKFSYFAAWSQNESTFGFNQVLFLFLMLPGAGKTQATQYFIYLFYVFYVIPYIVMVSH